MKVVSVIGDGNAPCGSSLYKCAYEVGKLIAKRGYVLVTGGLFGVMEGASRGAKEEGGVVVGILPYYETLSHKNTDGVGACKKRFSSFQLLRDSCSNRWKLWYTQRNRTRPKIGETGNRIPNLGVGRN